MLAMRYWGLRVVSVYSGGRVLIRQTHAAVEESAGAELRKAAVPDVER